MWSATAARIQPPPPRRRSHYRAAVTQRCYFLRRFSRRVSLGFGALWRGNNLASAPRPVGVRSFGAVSPTVRAFLGHAPLIALITCSPACAQSIARASRVCGVPLVPQSVFLAQSARTRAVIRVGRAYSSRDWAGHGVTERMPAHHRQTHSAAGRPGGRSVRSPDRRPGAPVPNANCRPTPVHAAGW